VLKRVKVIELVSLVYRFLKNELYLTWQMDELPRLVNNILTTLSEQGLLSENIENDSYARPGFEAKHHRYLNLLAKNYYPGS